MTKPLIVVAYDKLLPGTQLVNRLEDQGYRVKTASAASGLVDLVSQEMPLLVILDLGENSSDYDRSIKPLTQDANTAHIPIIALTNQSKPNMPDLARKAGATLVVDDSAILIHLDHFLKQALEI